MFYTSPDYVWGQMRRMKFAYAIMIAMLVTVTALPEANAKAKIFKPKGNPKYASVVVDADTGKIIHKDNAEKKRHPASLTKMMTLYLSFEALKNKRLSWHQRLEVSAEAASRPSTNLSLKTGDSIRVRDAVLGLIVRSANDAAVVLAEKLGGSEEGFARIMTKRARQLGMKNTTFMNASGLHHPKQITTAKDMALLAIALKKHYGQYYNYFSRSQMTYGGRKYTSHNKVTRTYPGADGLKTGYINASGFNLVTSAQRRGQNVVGVVLGGRTSKRRDAHMVKLLDEGFTKLAQEKTHRYVKLAKNFGAKDFNPIPVSKGYWKEGGYDKYIKAQNTEAIVGNLDTGTKKNSGSAKIAFIPVPKDKPRFLAQAQ